MKETPNTLKAVSYNIHKGFGVGNVKFLLKEIRSAIRLVNADLVMLQEVCGTVDKKKAPDQFLTESQFEFLADSVWSHFAYGKNAVYKTGDHGNALLSKFPIISNDNIDISTLQLSQRGILHSVIEFQTNQKKVPIHILCVHLGLLEAERKIQIERLCDLITTAIPDHQPLILAGDFNDWRQKADKTLTEKLNIKDAFQVKGGALAKTFPVWLPVFRLDRVYSRGLNIHHTEVLTGAPWNRLSDHAALMVEFSLL